MAADRHTGADSAPIAGLTWWLYAAIMSVILPILLVRVWWRGRHGEAYRAHWRERLGWYDLAVTTSASAAFLRRLAGRVETGRASVSDPATVTAK